MTSVIEATAGSELGEQKPKHSKEGDLFKHRAGSKYSPANCCFVLDVWWWRYRQKNIKLWRGAISAYVIAQE
jgi:hypothetical protein